VVQYWQNSPLGAVPGTTNAFTSSLLINAIPFNYGDGTSYNYSVRDSIGGTISFGQGDWIVDTDAGLLTFYSTVPSNMPPTISFYKYVGVKGFTSASVALTGSLLGTSSVAISSSYVEYANVGNKPTLISSSTQVNYNSIQNQPTTIPTASYVLNAVSSSFALTASYVSGAASDWDSIANKPSGLVSSSTQINTGSFSGSFTGVLIGTGSWAISASYAPPTFIDNLVTVGLAGSDTNYNSIKAAVDSITDASVTNTYTVRVYPGVYIEDTITLKPYIAIKGDSSISTIVSASNPSASIFVMADQTMVIDMQIQGSTAPNVSAVVYSSPTTPQTNAIAYVENVRFGTNYTNAKVIGSGSSGNCILQCSNVKYGGFTEGNKSFDVGFYVTSGSDGGIGRMQLRNVTSTNGGVAGTDDNQIFALADAPGCTFIVNGCLLTRSTGTARGTGFKVYNGGQLRLTGVNFQRWIKGIWAPQTGSAPNIDAIALNFENCTTDVDIQHTGSLGKVSGTDTFLKTLIAKDAPLYEVNQDPRRISVAKKGGDFTSISASVAYITDSAENNRYVIDVGPGQFTEKQIDLRGKPYIAILGSDIQTTVIIPSGSGTFDQLILGPTNEVSFLTLKGNNVAGYSAVSAPDVGQIVGSDFAQIHKISIYDYDYGIKVCADTANSTFYGEYVDINGSFSYGVYVSSSNNFTSLANVENYYLFPSNSSGIGNYAVGPSSSVSLYTGLFKGDNTAGSTAIKIEQGASLEAAGLDMQRWDYGVRVPAASPAPDFRIVGSMIHESNVYDFDVLNSSTRGRFQGVANHSKINNNSPDFYWNFLDDVDGENDVTRKLSVTFADGTHTDATTLIFKGSPMGVMEGGVITTGSGFNITVASGFGYVQDALDVTVYKRIDWVNGNLTLTANSNNYIYLTSAEVLTAAGSLPNNETNIILGRVVTNNTTIELIDQTPYNGEHMSNKLSTFNREALGPVYAAGSTVTEDSTPFKLDVTAGTYFFSENKFTPSGTSSINLTQYYPSASTWARYTSSVVPSNQYASSSALVAMSSSHYTKHTLYGVGEGVDEKYFLVINSNQYSTLVAAENANLPSIPTYFNDGVVALAAVYVQSGSSNITQIQDIRPVIGFRAAGVNASSVHGNLLGLSADDHTQYLLVNGARAMAGNLSLGGNNITNVGTMFGTASWANNAVAAITASAADSITFTPETASYSISSSFAIQAISASFAPTKAGVVSSSAQINTGSFTGSFAGTFIGTSSWASNATSASYVLPSGLPAGTVSSSIQVSYTGLSNVPANIVSSSAQVTAFLPTGTVSSSTQINTGSFTGSFIGTHSGSTFGTASWASNAVSASWAPTGSAFPYIGTAEITGSLKVSGSTLLTGSVQITNAGATLTFSSTAGATDITQNNGEVRIQGYTFLGGGGLYPQSDNIRDLGLSSQRWRNGYIINVFSNNISTSGSITNTGSLNILSGSIKVTNGDITSSLFGTSSFATSASFAPTILPSGTVSSSGQVSYTGLSNVPSGIISSSTQVTAFLPTGTVSSSVQINTGSFTGSFTGTLIGTSSVATSASFAPTILPSGVVSSSGQVSYTGLSNVPANIVSSSGQVTAFLPTGTVSSSVQINTGSFTGSFIGTHSGSTFGTASFATSASFAPTILPSGVVSSSGQVSYTGLSNIPANIVSSSAQVTAFLPVGTVSSSTQINTGSFSGSITTASFATSASFAPTILPSGLVSSSTQINTGSFTGSFTGTLIGTSSWSSNAISSSFATTSSFTTSASFAPTILPSGVVSSSGQVSYTGLSNIPSGIVSSSGQVTTLLPVGTVSSSIQINTGSFTGSFTGTLTGSLFGTASWANNATSASFATSASYAPTILPSGVVSSSTQVSYTGLSNIPASIVSSSTQVTAFLPVGTISSSGQVSYTGLSNVPSGIVSSSAQVTAFLPSGTVSSSVQINTGSFTGSFTGTLIGTSSWANNAISASYVLPTGLPVGTVSSSGQVSYTGLSNIPANIVSSSVQVTAFLPAGTVSSSVQINTGSFTGSFIGTHSGSTFGTASNATSASFAVSASWAPSSAGSGVTSITVSDGLSGGVITTTGTISLNTGSAHFLDGVKTKLNTEGVVSSSQQINTGSFTGSFTGTLLGTSSNATSASYALSASFAPGGGTTFPYTGTAVISGSLIVTGSSGVTVTGPVTITGALQATTKSFKINHQRLLGKKLIYGVLEGPEHGVYVRGRLTKHTVIQLPEEWKWLIDPDSITVQLTPIGIHQSLYVQNIENNTVIINSNTPIDCFYFIQATRKDVAPLTTVE
jgi:hypothetical protein